MKISVPPGRLGALNADVEECYAFNDWRPTAVAVLEAPDGRILRACTKGGWWGFPQGRIEQGEDILAGCCREVHEELGFEHSIFDEARGFVYQGDLQVPNNPDGFKHGKRLYYFHFILHGTPFITLNTGELSACEWDQPDRVYQFFSGLRRVYTEKRRQLLQVISLLPSMPQGALPF
ncbi:MAG: mismatch repair protein MutT [Parcubacteria group bacterium]|nr:mismatch repair protein MutT [Parcubacteria group bacterium]